MERPTGRGNRRATAQSRATAADESYMFASEPSAPQQAPGIIDATLRYRELTIALTVAGLVLGALYGLLGSSASVAVGRLILTDPRGSATFRDGSSVVDFSRYVNDRVDFAKSGEVLEAAAEKSPKAGSASDIRSACEMTAEDGRSVLTITCTHSDPAIAVATVDAVAEAYREKTAAQTDRKADAAIEALTTEREELDAKLEELATAEGSPQYIQAVTAATSQRLSELEERRTSIRTNQELFGNGTESYDVARIQPSAGRLSLMVRNGFIGGVVGFLGAVLVAWFRADRDPIADSPNEVANWIGLPLLGEIEHRYLESDTINLTSPPESTFQRVSSNLDAVLQGDTVLFTPAEPLARHEDVVIKTALTAARAGKRVLLIDADSSGRSISNILGLPPGAGLAEFVAGEARAEEATVRLGFGKVPGLASSSLYLMGPGGEPGQPPALFRSVETAEAIRELEQSYDLILIDGPPLLTSAGSAVMGQVVDGIVVMIERGTSKPVVEDTRRQLAFLSGDPVGFVFIHDA